MDSTKTCAGGIVGTLFVPLQGGGVVNPELFVILTDKFDRGILFGLGLMLLSFIFYPILGFGSYQYQDATPSADASFQD